MPRGPSTPTDWSRRRNPPCRHRRNDGARFASSRWGRFTSRVGRWRVMPLAPTRPASGVRRDDSGLVVTNDRSRFQKLPHIHCRPGLEPGPIPRDARCGQNACGSACVSPEPAVVMGSCVRRDDGGFGGDVIEQPQCVGRVEGDRVRARRGPVAGSDVTRLFTIAITAGPEDVRLVGSNGSHRPTFRRTRMTQAV